MVSLLWLLPMSYAARAADAKSCEKPRLSTDASLAGAWPAAVLEVERQLDQDVDVDDCATVYLHGAPPDVTVRVVLADGRTTVRHVAKEEALAAAVKALVTRLPEFDPRPPARPEVPPSVTPRKPAPRHRVTLESGAAATLRIAARPLFLGYGVGAHLYAAIDEWLVGGWVRWDLSDLAVAQKNVPSDYEMSSFLLGILVGRRFGIGPCLLDLMLGPNLMVENQEAFENTSMDTGGVFTDVTFGGNLRLLVPRKRRARFLVLVAADVYPRRAGRTVQRFPPLATLPAYTATVGLGVSWSAL